MDRQPKKEGRKDDAWGALTQSRRDCHGSATVLSFLLSCPVRSIISSPSPLRMSHRQWAGWGKKKKEKKDRRREERGRMQKKMGGGQTKEMEGGRNRTDGRTDERASERGKKKKNETPSRSACTVVAFISRCQMRPQLRIASCWDARRRRTRRDTSLFSVS